MSEVAEADGHASRKARTRRRLIDAGLAFLAEGNPNPSIQAITERAGVGFGSFFNHFGGKVDLFTAALEGAFRVADQLMSDHVQQIDDPLERMVIQMRLFGRLPEIDPAVARALAFSPVDTFGVDSGYGLSFEANVLAAKESGRLPRPRDSNVAQTFIWGAFRHLLLLRCTTSDHPPEWVDDFTEIALTTWGLDHETAYALAHGPLPEIS